MNLPNFVLSNTELVYLFLSILSLLAAAHFLGFLFTKLKLPRVTGEILGGILLGPSCLGHFAPHAYIKLFNFFPAQGTVLAYVYWMGLVLLMLTAGFKVKHTIDPPDKKILVNLLIGSTIPPLIGGIIYFYLYDFTAYKGTAGTNLSLCIIIAASVVVTSIPVISKIFMDLNIMGSRFAKIVLATSVLQDLALWIALDVALKPSITDNLKIAVSAIITLVFMLVCLRIAFYLKHYIKVKEKGLSETITSIGYILIFTFIMILISNFLGINIIFGVFMAGIIISSMPSEYVQKAKDSLANFSLSFFIPLYFAIVGLKLNLVAHFDLSLFLNFLIISSILQIAPVIAGLRLLKESWIHCLSFGFATNARGGPGIVIASLAYELSIIDARLFAVLVLSSIITSVISGAWFRFALNKYGSLYKE